MPQMLNLKLNGSGFMFLTKIFERITPFPLMLLKNEETTKADSLWCLHDRKGGIKSQRLQDNIKKKNTINKIWRKKNNRDWCNRLWVRLPIKFNFFCYIAQHCSNYLLATGSKNKTVRRIIYIKKKNCQSVSC